MTQKTTLKQIVLAGLTALSFNSATLEAKAQTPVKTSGDVTYFASEEAKSPAQNSYVEINHSTALPTGTRVSGFIDFYNGNNGYFAKTVGEQSLTDSLSLRTHAIHANEGLTQAGFGASYVLPSPKGTFAKISYLPYFTDTKGEHVEDKQIAAYFASAKLSEKVNAFSFAEVNVDGTKGPQWAYGEVELATKLGNNLTLGANLQLNGQGAGKMTPDVVPRIALRAKF